MLVLTRKTQQQIRIGDKVTITIVRVTGQSVRVGIEAPEEVRVIRGELVGKPPKESQPAESPAAPMAACGSTSGASGELPAPPAGPLASRCRSRMLLATSASGSSEATAEPQACLERRRAAGASFAPVIRRPQRLGPASVGALCRMR